VTKILRLLADYVLLDMTGHYRTGLQGD